ncbi:MAG: transcription elongation factor GreA [Myxococcales bacterium]|nr:transcription elongation factor GreA [Myxococcales bacterium]
MDERLPMTEEGYRALKERLRVLKEIERPKNVRDIETAREHGDLSENAEYHAAKEKQGIIAAQLRDVEDKIARAQVINPASLQGDKIVFGATVHLLDLNKDETVIYQIVGQDEADLKANKISYSAPLGRALIGRRVGDEVNFRSPGGLREYEVVAIEFK